MPGLQVPIIIPELVQALDSEPNNAILCAGETWGDLPHPPSPNETKHTHPPNAPNAKYKKPTQETRCKKLPNEKGASKPSAHHGGDLYAFPHASSEKETYCGAITSPWAIPKKPGHEGPNQSPSRFTFRSMGEGWQVQTLYIREQGQVKGAHVRIRADGVGGEFSQLLPNLELGTNLTNQLARGKETPNTLQEH